MEIESLFDGTDSQTHLWPSHSDQPNKKLAAILVYQIQHDVSSHSGEPNTDVSRTHFNKFNDFFHGVYKTRRESHRGLWIAEAPVLHNKSL